MLSVGRKRLNRILRAIRVGDLLLNDVIDFFAPFNARTQVLPSRLEIREQFFAEHLVNRSISIKQPISPDFSNNDRLVILHNQRKQAISRVRLWMEKAFGSAYTSYVFRYRERLDRTFAQVDQPLERSTMSNKELGTIKGRITKEQKQKPKVELVTPPPTKRNETQAAIERRAFLEFYLSM